MTNINKKIKSEYEKLNDEYEKKLSNLQKSCKHESKSEWIDWYWGLGHGPMYQVKICNNCNKTLLYKYTCSVCNKEFISESQPLGLMCDSCRKKILRSDK